MRNIDKFAGYMLSKRLVDKNGQPIKCEYCGSDNLIDANGTYNMDGSLYAYDKICADCGEQAGHCTEGIWSV